MTLRMGIALKRWALLVFWVLLTLAGSAAFVHDLVWSPKVVVGVRAVGDRNALSNADEVWFQLWRDSVKKVSSWNITRDASWIEKNGWHVAPEASGTEAIYAGRYTAGMRVRFHTHPWSGKVLLSVNGKESTLDLSSPIDTDIEIALDTPSKNASPPWLTMLLTVFLSGVLLSAIPRFWRRGSERMTPWNAPWDYAGSFFLGLWVVLTYPIDGGGVVISAGAVVLFGVFLVALGHYLARFPGIRSPAHMSASAVYAPIAIAGLLLLGIWLLFWPAILSQDSIAILEQIIHDAYTDWHPAAYVLFVGMTFWIAASPAAMILLQALSLLTIYAWGVWILYRHGGGALGAYASWILLVISPVSMILLVTLWKDIPYGLALLALTISAAAVYVSEGEWLKSPSNLAWLVLSTVAVSLFRHNGLPAAVLTVVAIMLAYPAYWRRLVVAVIVLFAVIAMIRGPVYDAFGVSRVGVTHALFAHHIAAHLSAGSNLTEEDRQFLNTIRPVEGGWGYACGSVNPTVFNENYDSEKAEAERLRLAAVAIRLALADPLTEIRHVVCVGSLVWRMTNDDRFAPYVFGIWTEEDKSRYIYENRLGFSEATWATSLRNRLARQLNELPVFAYRPALWSYLLIFLVVVHWARSKDWRILIVVTPIVIHSAFLMVFNVAQDVRYQYPVFLVFGLLAPWLLLAAPVRHKNHPSGIGLNE